MKQHAALYWASLKSLIIDTPARAAAVFGVACLVSGCRFWLKYGRHGDSSVFSLEKPEDVEMPDLTEALIQDQKVMLHAIDVERCKIAALEKEKDEQRDVSDVGHTGIGTRTAA